MEAGINTRIKTLVHFNNVLHGFFAGRETETVIMDLKKLQELKSVEQDPLFLIYLDIRKTYDNLNHGRLLQMLVGYREGLKLWGLLDEI